MKNAVVITVVYLLCFYVVLLCIKKYVPFVYINNDFFDYYIGSKLFWAGKYVYGPNPDFISLVKLYRLEFMWATGYSYPPPLAWFLYPLLFLSPQNASSLWLLVNLLIFGVFTLYTYKKMGRSRLVVIYYILSYLPILFSVATGQINIFILFLISYYLYSCSSTSSSFFLACASVIKIYPVLFLIKEGLQKNHFFVLKTIFFIAVLLGLTVVVRGTLPIRDYFVRELPKLHNSPHTYYINQSVNGVLSRIYAAPEKSDKVIIAPELLSLINIYVSLGILTPLVIFTLKGGKYNKQALGLMWLGVITLIAGKNSFWNFAPCVLIGIYLIEHWDKLPKQERILFIISTGITNGLWLGVYFFEQWLSPGESIISKVVYASLSSIGFIALVFQLFILRVFFIPR